MGESTNARAKLLPSRLGCPLSLKTPNMGNPGLTAFVDAPTITVANDGGFFGHLQSDMGNVGWNVRISWPRLASIPTESAVSSSFTTRAGTTSTACTSTGAR